MYSDNTISGSQTISTTPTSLLSGSTSLPSQSSTTARVWAHVSCSAAATGDGFTVYLVDANGAVLWSETRYGAWATVVVPGVPVVGAWDLVAVKLGGTDRDVSCSGFLDVGAPTPEQVYDAATYVPAMAALCENSSTTTSVVMFGTGEEAAAALTNDAWNGALLVVYYASGAIAVRTITDHAYSMPGPPPPTITLTVAALPVAPTSADRAAVLTKRPIGAAAIDLPITLTALSNMDAAISTRAEPGDAMDLISGAVDDVVDEIGVRVAAGTLLSIDGTAYDEAMTDVVDGVSSIGAGMNDLSDHLIRLLGLTRSNTVLDEATHDGGKRLTSARLRVFADAGDAAAATAGAADDADGEIARYALSATYDGGGKLVSQRLVAEL